MGSNDDKWNKGIGSTEFKKNVCIAFFLMHLLQKTISWWLCIYGRGTISHVCCAESLSHIQLFVTSWTVARQAPLSMEILQARILEWTVMPSSRESSQCRDRTQVSHTAGGFFTVWATREALHISFTEWISYSWLRILQRGTGGQPGPCSSLRFRSFLW